MNESAFLALCDAIDEADFDQLETMMDHINKLRTEGPVDDDTAYVEEIF